MLKAHVEKNLKTKPTPNNLAEPEENTNILSVCLSGLSGPYFPLTSVCVSVWTVWTLLSADVCLSVMLCAWLFWAWL